MKSHNARADKMRANFLLSSQKSMQSSEMVSEAFNRIETFKESLKTVPVNFVEAKDKIALAAQNNAKKHHISLSSVVGLNFGNEREKLIEEPD